MRPLAPRLSPPLAPRSGHPGASREVVSLDASIRRYLNPHVYQVGLEQALHKFRTQLMLKAARAAGVGLPLRIRKATTSTCLALLYYSA